MTRLASTLSLALLLSVVSCGSSSSTPTVDTGVTGDGPSTTADTAVTTGDAPSSSDVATTDGAVAGMCTGSFSTINRATLGVATMASGKCSGAGDLDLICDKNIKDIAGACGLACLGMGEACISPCVKAKVALSDGCLGCYAQAVLCAQMHCAAPCVVDSTSAACTECQLTNGCLSAFFGCSGLPAPPAGDGGVPAGDGGTTGDGGASDAPASPDAPAATDTAVTTDSSTD